MALPYDPNFTMAVSLGRIYTDGAPEHDASVSAAIVAAELISSARLARKLDSVHTEYSAQYLVDKVPRKKQGGRDLKLTVKDCLEFALKEGIPKEDRWPHLGSGIKLPSSFQPALVSMKGEVVEAKSIEEACDLLTDQPVGAKLHMFSPQFDLQQDGVYCGVSGEPSSYVGLRDGIIVKVERIQGKSIATVKLWYKNKFQSVKVATSRWFSFASPKNINPRAPAPPFLLVDPGAIEPPTYLLVDFCVPRLSIN